MPTKGVTPDDGFSEPEEIETLDEFLRDHLQTSTATNDHPGLPSLDWLKANFKTKSGVIRHLKQLGYDAKTISKHTGLKYQHCYNVMHSEPKRGPNEIMHPQTIWACSHTTSIAIIDVIARKGERDPDGSRILYRVCASCAKGILPGVTEESISKLLPGVKQ